MLEFVKYSIAFKECKNSECNVRISIKYPILNQNPSKNYIEHNVKITELNFYNKKFKQPESLKEKLLEGNVLLNVLIDTTGVIDSIKVICSNKDILTKAAIDEIYKTEIKPQLNKDSVVFKYWKPFFINFKLKESPTISFLKNIFLPEYDSGQFRSIYHTIGFSTNLTPIDNTGLNTKNGFGFTIDYVKYRYYELFDFEKNRKNNLIFYFGLGICYNNFDYYINNLDGNNSLSGSSLGLSYSFGYGYTISKKIFLNLLYRENLPYIGTAPLMRFGSKESLDSSIISHEVIKKPTLQSELGLSFNYKDYFTVDVSYNMLISCDNYLAWSLFPKTILAALSSYLFLNPAIKSGNYLIPIADFLIKSSMTYILYHNQKSNPYFPFGKGGESIWLENVKLKFNIPLGIFWGYESD